MNIDATAREVIALLTRCGLDACDGEPCLCRHTVIAALQSARNEALEQAAQLLLKEAKELKDGPGYYGEEIQDYERLADAVRSLKEGT